MTYSAGDVAAALYPTFTASGETATCTGTANAYNNDPAGQFTSTSTAPAFALAYNASLQATSIQQPAGNPVAYSYSDAGNPTRVGGTVAATGASFAYINGPLGVQARTVSGTGIYDGTTYYTRDPGGNLIDEHGGPAGINVYETDAQNNVVALYGAKNAAGTAVNATTATYKYAPFADSSTIANTGAANAFGNAADDNPFRFISGYFDELEGDNFYHLGARYLRGGWFTQPDPARAGSNLYSYADGDPVNGSDPSGRCDGTAIGPGVTINLCPVLDTLTGATETGGEGCATAVGVGLGFIALGVPEADVTQGAALGACFAGAVGDLARASL